MAIKDIFKMIKADRYTQDGREELIKAQEAVTEDVTYKPGDISRKTGLQKQPDGSWAPVKNAPAQSKKMDKAKQSEIAKQAEFEKTVGDPAKARADYWNEINEASQRPMPGVEELYNKTVGKESASGSAPSMTSEQRKKWEAKASNPSETKASLTNFINSMENSESFKKANPHAQEIIDIYKTELKKREDNASYRPEKVYSDAPSASGSATTATLKIKNHADLLKKAEKIYVDAEGKSSDLNLSREERLKARDKEQDSYKLRELLEFGVDKNGVPKNEENAAKIQELVQSLGLNESQDSAPRILTGDCKIRIKKSK